jgi:thiol-disulfide isomerase/thioredoxin
MLERLILVLVLAALVTVAVVAIRAWNARRTQTVQQGGPAWGALGAQPDGRRTLIAFSTPSCPACHKAQAPAIALAERQLGPEHIRVIKVDTASQPEVARAFGVMTVPTTIVVEAKGHQIVAINQGFVPSARLIEQLQARLN